MPPAEIRNAASPRMSELIKNILILRKTCVLCCCEGWTMGRRQVEIDIAKKTSSKTWENVVSNSKRGKIGVRDVDRHKGEEVGEGEEQEGEQPTMFIYNFCFII